MKSIFIILSFLINLNLISTDLHRELTIEFYNYADLETFIDESINLPLDILEIPLLDRSIRPSIIVRYEENIKLQSIARLIYQYITVDIKNIN